MIDFGSNVLSFPLTVLTSLHLQARSSLLSVVGESTRYVSTGTRDSCHNAHDNQRLIDPRIGKLFQKWRAVLGLRRVGWSYITTHSPFNQQVPSFTARDILLWTSDNISEHFQSTIITTWKSRKKIPAFSLPLPPPLPLSFSLSLSLSIALSVSSSSSRSKMIRSDGTLNWVPQRKTPPDLPPTDGMQPNYSVLASKQLNQSWQKQLFMVAFFFLRLSFLFPFLWCVHSGLVFIGLIEWLRAH